MNISRSVHRGRNPAASRGHVRVQGFSLVELMITVLIVAILTAIAWPSFRDFMHRNTVTAQANQVLASLQYARNEAVSRRYPTGVCASASTGSTPPACDGGNAFDGGWIVWRSQALSISGVPSYNSGGASPDELLRVTQPQTGISMESFGGSGGVTPGVIAFDQRGAVIGAGGAATNIVICAKDKPGDSLGANTDKVPGKYVRIDASGRITIQNLASGAACDAAPA